MAENIINVGSIVIDKSDDRRIRRFFANPWFWVVILSFNFSFPLVRSLMRELPKAPNVIVQLPPYKFVNEMGASFGSDDLKGKIYIANFFFSSCPTTCPKLLSEFEKIQKRLRGMGDAVRLVSFSVDPENDVPPVLFETARKYHANSRLWTFLTGNYSEMEKTVVDGFKVYMGDSKKQHQDREEINMVDIAHSEKFVLVDKDGGIRGYYAADKESINKMLIDIGLLANRN